MKNVKKNYHMLALLAKTTPSQRKAILKEATPNQVKVLCEICDNLRRGNIPTDVRKLRKYKKIIRKLSEKRVPLNTKKKILVNQSGGFLPLLLAPLLSMAGGLIGKVIGKRI